MDYGTLAKELLNIMSESSRMKYRRDAADFAHGEMSILAYLCFHEDGVCAGRLCGELKMTTPRISAALSGLLKKNFISKETDLNDRRRIHIFITDKGRELVIKKHEELQENITRMLSLLGEHDAREYVRLSGKISELEEV